MGCRRTTDQPYRRGQPPRKEICQILCSIIFNGNLNVFQVTTNGELVHGSHAAGTGAFPIETITAGCDPTVPPSAQTFNNLHVFAQKASGEIVWGVAAHRGKWGVKVLGA
jgi:hypothetical protein